MKWIMDKLSLLDSDLLVYINGIHSAWSDELMYDVSNTWFWLPLYILIFILVIRNYSLKNSLIIFVCTTILLLVTDQVCASVIRPWLGRLRPTHELDGIGDIIHIVHDYRGGKYGFPSCHAANSMAIAVYFSLFIKRNWFRLLIFAWVLVVSYSRIYLGVHYPGDILGGMMFGTLFAYILYRITQLLLKHIDHIHLLH